MVSVQVINSPVKGQGGEADRLIEWAEQAVVLV